MDGTADRSAAGPLLDLAAGLVRRALAGTPDAPAEYLAAILLGSRALLRLGLEVGPLAFPHLDRYAVARAVRSMAAAALEDMASRAGLDRAGRATLALALEMGLDWPDEAGRDVVASELDGRPISLVGPPVSCAQMAATLDYIRRLEALGLTPGAIRSTLLKAFAAAAEGYGLSEMARETHLAENHRLIDALLDAQPGARPPCPSPKTSPA